MPNFFSCENKAQLMNYSLTINIAPVTLKNTRNIRIILLGLRAFDIVTGRTEFNNGVEKTETKNDARNVLSFSLPVIFLACI